MISDRQRRFPPRPSGRWSLQLPNDLVAARTARAAVKHWLRHADDSLVGDARSVVTELVSNAVRHGRPPITMTVELDGDRCRVEVVDAGASEGRDWPADGGWGLRIVGRLAERWGFDEPSSCAWCELRARPATPLVGHGADDRS